MPRSRRWAACPRPTPPAGPEGTATVVARSPQVCAEYYAVTPDLESHGESYAETLKRMHALLYEFPSPPFTTQRLVELLLDPHRIYRVSTRKLMHALEKLLTVSSTDPVMVIAPTKPGTYQVRRPPPDAARAASRRPRRQPPPTAARHPRRQPRGALRRRWPSTIWPRSPRETTPPRTPRPWTSRHSGPGRCDRRPPSHLCQRVVPRPPSGLCACQCAVCAAARGSRLHEGVCASPARHASTQ